MKNNFTPSFLSAKSELLALEAILKAHGDKRGVERLQEKQQDLNDPSVFVFVIGEGNFGKSSIINHLLGREVAEVYHLPKTWRIDLYRASPNGREYAELRRSKVPGTQTLSIDEAIMECKQQEAQVIKENYGRRDGGDASTLDGQIIEVNWYYTGLATPVEVVLVDTPGFLQALGINRKHIDTLSK